MFSLFPVGLAVTLVIFIYAYGSEGKSFETERIINGHYAKDGEFPYVAALSCRDTFCTATIISRNCILTAAHCVVDDQGNKAPPESCNALIGTKDIGVGNQGTIVTFTSITVHPSYNYSSVVQGNDLAILKTSQPIVFVPSKIQPVPLAKSETTDKYTDTIVAGWGVTIPSSDLLLGPHDSLKYAHQTIHNPNNILQEVQCIMRIEKDKQLCASHLFEGPCNGDSGGPLMTANYSAQVGITSYGPKNICGSTPIDMIYTKVRYFIQWILETCNDPEIKTV